MKDKLFKGMLIISISKHPIIGIITKIGGTRKRKEPSLISIIKLDGKHTCLNIADVSIYKTSIDNRNMLRRKCKEAAEKEGESKIRKSRRKSKKFRKSRRRKK